VKPEILTSSAALAGVIEASGATHRIASAMKSLIVLLK
jgi:hypothetical protein